MKNKLQKLQEELDWHCTLLNNAADEMKDEIRKDIKAIEAEMQKLKKAQNQ